MYGLLTNLEATDQLIVFTVTNICVRSIEKPGGKRGWQLMGRQLNRSLLLSQVIM